MSELDAFRAAKDRFFREHPNSPLTDEQRRTFAGLRYFPEDPTLRLSLPVELLERPSTIVMPTSAGDTRTYRRLGRVRLAIDGHDAALTLFADESGALFLPFADAPAATSTPSRSATGGCSSTSTWPTTRPAPTTTAGPARSRRPRTA